MPEPIEAKSTPDLLARLRDLEADDSPAAIDVSWHDRFVFDFNVSETSPVIKGTWVTVAHVVLLIVDGWSWSDILRCHPELTENDIRACLAYTLDQENEECDPVPRPSQSETSIGAVIVPLEPATPSDLLTRVRDLEADNARLRKLVWGAVLCAGQPTSRSRGPAWAFVKQALGCGSGVATSLCVEFERDPDEEVVL